MLQSTFCRQVYQKEEHDKRTYRDRVQHPSEPTASRNCTSTRFIRDPGVLYTNYAVVSFEQKQCLCNTHLWCDTIKSFFADLLDPQCWSGCRFLHCILILICRLKSVFSLFVFVYFLVTFLANIFWIKNHNKPSKYIVVCKWCLV